MKKNIFLILLLSFILSIVIPEYVVAETQEKYLSSGKILQSIGILDGNSNGDLMLDKNLSRQDMVVLISRLYKEENKAKAFIIKPKFLDLTEEHKFYIPYIGWAVDKGLIKGMDKDNFGFGLNVTVQQFQVVLLRTLGYEEEARLWSTVPELAEKLGIMKDLKANSKDNLTRGQMAVMTLNTLQLTKKGSTITLSEVLNIVIP